MPALELHLYGFVTVALAGVGAGLTFDLLRGIRRQLRPGGLLAELLDLLYWLLVTGLVGVAIFLANRGELRFYVVLGLATGAALYFALASPVLLWLVELLLAALLTLLGWIVAAVQTLVVRPLWWLVGMALRLIGGAGRAGKRVAFWLVAPLRPVMRRVRRWAAGTWAGRVARAALDWLLPRPPDPGGPPDTGGPPNSGGYGGQEWADDPEDPDLTHRPPPR